MKKRLWAGIAAVLLVVVVAIGYKPARLFMRIWSPQKQNLPLADHLVALGSEKGKALAAANADDADFPALQAAFEPQQHGSFCGVASAVIALKALGVSDVDQDSLFTDKAAAIRGKWKVFYGGMNLDTLGALLAAHGMKTTVRHAGDSDLATFRSDVVANLKRPGDVVLINYLRRAIDQQRGGHISPIAAWDDASDRVLILDTSDYKYPPVWVAADKLFAAMNTVDSDGGKTRGWVLVASP